MFGKKNELEKLREATFGDAGKYVTKLREENYALKLYNHELLMQINKMQHQIDSMKGIIKKLGGN